MMTEKRSQLFLALLTDRSLSLQQMTSGSFSMPFTPRSFSPSLPLILAGIVLSGCGQPAASPPPPRSVLVQAATPGGSAVTVYTGEIRARHETDLAFRVGGKITSRLVDTGATVTPGQPLAKLDPADLQLALQAARAQLAAAESDHATAKAEQARYADLLAKKFVSQAAFDAKDNAYHAAQARLEQARAQAAVSGNQAGYGVLSTDQAGVITAVLADAGQVVSPGQAVLRLARPEEKEVAIAVPEGRVAELQSAKEMTVNLWADAGQTLKGELRELAPAADAATRTYAARIRLISPPPQVQLGMTARVMLGVPATGAPLVVPLSAVVDQGQGASVWVVDHDKVQRRPVHISQFREDGAVIAGGLQAGELVVVAGTNKLVPDMAVTPKPVTPPEKQR